MSEHISTATAKIRALKTSIVSLLENEGDVIPREQVEQGSKLVIAAYQDILNLGSKQLIRLSLDSVRESLRLVQSAYADWRDIDTAFTNAMQLAYNGYVTRDALQLDAVYENLKQRVGDPIASLYTRLQAHWSEHLETAPWDEFVANDIHDANTVRLNANLKSLIHGDHLDVEDAVEGLTGPLRYAFANYLEARVDSIDLLEESLWMRPEIVVINDYWRHKPGVRILDVLTRKADKFSGSFARVQDFFSQQNGTSHPESIVKAIKELRPEQRETYFRCLMLHPDQQVRRYAVNNVNIESFWNVVTPQAVPCATILNMLEKVAGSQNYDEDFQKIFFQTIHRRLLALTSRSDVIYARGIVRIFTSLPFFMEDDYFEKLRVIMDYLSAKERAYKMQDGVLDTYIAHLTDEKEKIGTLQAQSPRLSQIPPVVLRKLARDGHFWFELSRHPLYKIARETIGHINSQDRALRIANSHVVSQDVIRAVGRNRSLFNTRTAKIALLSNPKTPPTVSLAYLMDLTKGDSEQLLRTSTVHPELRPHLQRRLNA